MDNSSTTDTRPDIEAIAADIRAYIDTTAELYKMKAAEKSALLVSDLAILALLAFFSTLVILFLSVAVAIFLGKLMGHIAYGYLVVAGIYLLNATFLYATRDRWLKGRLADRIIKNIFSK